MNIIKYPNFTISKDVEHLSEVIDCLPHNGIFNKVTTGSGGTTVALKSNEHYVVCVPFTELIKNKIASKMNTEKNILGVHEGVSVNRIKEYLSDYRIPIKKIMVTYDSLPKIMKYINPQDYKLLIDEYQELFTSYVFRNLAIRKVLNNYDKFKSFCFMTATMMDDDFVIKELKHLPVYEADWESIREVTIESCECKDNVIHTVCLLVDNFIKGTYSGNAHIFVNSVEFIKQVVKNCKLTDETARAIWSQYNESKVGLKRGSTIDVAKKINFYSSCVFVGSDLHDEEGHIFIVSDSHKQHSLVDIYTSVHQIAGRIRDTHFKDKIHHIYTTTRYKNSMTYEEYKEHVANEVINCKVSLNNISNLDENSKKLIQSTVKKTQDKRLGEYIALVDNNFIFDENLTNFDLYNFKLTKCTYKVKINIAQEYENAGFKMTVYDPIKEIEELTGKECKLKKVSAINPRENLKENIEEFEKGDSDFAQWMYKQYNWFYDAIIYLGIEKIKELDGNITNIKRHTNNKKYTNQDSRIKAELSLHYKITEGVFVPTKEIKVVFQEVYNNLEMSLSPKGSSIEKYWYCKKIVKNIKGASILGYELYKPLSN